MDKKILIKNARAIVSCDGEDRVYRDADMLIEGPKILAIGRDLMNGGDPASGRNLNQEEVQVIRAEGKFVYPGLINTHHHFFQTFVRNLMTIDYPNMMVMDWIDKIYRIFQNIDSDVIYYSTLTSFADLMKHGCTCAFDHQYCYPAYDPPQGGTGPRRGVGLPACPERDKNTLFSAYGSRDTGKKPGFRKKD